jgi:hypothetical protein
VRGEPLLLNPVTPEKELFFQWGATLALALTLTLTLTRLLIFIALAYYIIIIK